MAGTFAATYARGTRRGWVALWGGFVAAGLLLIAFAATTGPGLLWLPGALLVVPFGALLVLTLRRLADPRPVIVIDAAGYHDRRLGDVIPWTQITALQSDRRGNRVFMQIGVADPARYLGNAGWMRGPMLRVNPRMGFTAIGSNLSGLDVAQERLADAATAWWASR